MSGLVLKLAPSERILLNGAVIRNGSKNTRITILTPEARLLRLRDAIHPDDAQTPITRTCYIAQLILSGDESTQTGHRLILNNINELLGVFSDLGIQDALSSAAAEFDAGRTYSGLKLLRQLISIERNMLESREA